MKKIKLLQGIVSVIAFMGMCNIAEAVLAVPPDPASAPITFGRWHAGLQKGIDLSDAEDIPMVLVWGDPGCSNCTALDKQLDSAAFKEWMGRRQLIMIYVKNSYGSWESKWSRGVSPYSQQYTLFGYPYVAVYWKSKNTKAFNFEGKGMKADAVITKIESYITQYSSADLSSLEIIGPSIAGENLTIGYECVAKYSNGSTKRVTSTASWQENSASTTISTGQLAVGPLNANGQVVIAASYTEGTISKNTTLTVTLADKTMAGAGTQPDPYRITSKAEFLYMAYNTADYDKHYELMTDIDLEGEQFVRSVIAPNGATGSTYTGNAFHGVFNGNGNVVKNVTINTIQANESNLGLFGRLNGGTVIALGVRDISITDDSATALYVGGFCGQSRGTSMISECYVNGADVAGKSYVGGFIGVNSGSTINNSSARGSAAYGITEYTAGFCGNNEQAGVLQNCYATTTVSGAGTKGGFCALKGTTSTVLNSFWDTQTSGMTTSAGGTGKTTAQMQTKATYTAVGWNFTEIWGIEPNDYPFLSAFGDAPVVRYSGGVGTESSPYRIANKEDLSCLATNTPDYGKWFVLGADIDLAGKTYTTAVIAPDASSADEEFTGDRFTGSFDGAGFSIDNLTIDAGSTGNDFLGLFGENQGAIRNLNLRNAAVNGGAGSIALAVLCAHNVDACSGFSQITGCSVEGVITGGSELSGGLCAFNQGVISQCSANVMVAGGNVSGGFSARNFCGNITDCISKGSISGSHRIAGFCAENSGVIDRCYSIAPVAAASDYAGFCYTNAVEDGCGMCGPGGEVYIGAVSNSFWDVAASGVASSEQGAKGKTTAQMGTTSTFTAAGWNFAAAGVWYMNAYPELRMFYQEYAGGSGTEADPFKIGTKREFKNFAANTADYGKHFELTSDIDLTGETFGRAVVAPNAAGGGTTYSGVSFKGVFDGNGHVVRNIKIVTTRAEESNIGLFGRLSGGKVTCLGVENITVTDSSASARYVGGLCGQSRDSSTITACYVKAANLQAKWYVGGLVGVNNGNATISDCFASGAVRSLTGGSHAGGFCGINEVSGKLKNCYSTTAVTAVSGTGKKGGFCATLDNSTVTACFWDTTTSGLATSSGGVGKTTAQMKTESTFTSASWDFTGTWSMGGYPELRCFSQSSVASAQLTIVGGTGGGAYSNGMEIAISAVIPANYIFRQWTSVPAGFAANIEDYLDPTTTFTMPAVPVELKANFLKRPDVVPQYSGAVPNHWTMDYEAAMAYAAAHNMPTIFLFTGAWWCPDCHSFDPSVLESPVWLNYLAANPTMLVMLDYEIRPKYGLPRTYLSNHCFLWDEKFLSDNGLTPVVAEARLARFHELETEYTLPSRESVSYPTFVVHRPDGSRAGRMGLERTDNPTATSVIRWLGQALASDPADELDDEALMAPPTLTIPNDESPSVAIAATLSEIDRADNYRFAVLDGNSYIFKFTANSPHPTVPLTVSILAANGLDVLKSAVVNPATGGSCTFEELPPGNCFVKVAAQSPVTGQVGYFMSAKRDLPYSGGMGTAGSPYLISNVTDFMDFAAKTAHYAKHFKLTSDIDLTGKTFARAVIAPNVTGGGTTYSGVPFTGVFNGNGHVIRNVKIVTALANESNIGVFGRLSGAGCEVRQLGVENITVTDTSKTARYVGGLCGQLRSGAAINQCYVKAANLQGKWYVGGLAGVSNGSAAITDCFASGAVRTLTGGSYAGGFCGISEVSSKLKNCYSTTAVAGAGTKGGFCPKKDTTSTVTGCFWNTTTSGQSKSAGGGTGRTTTQMKTKSTFTGASWNFTSIWMMDGYPALNTFAAGAAYQQWLTLSGVPEDQQGHEDVPAEDGVPNLLKFASGLEPMTPAATSDLMDLPADTETGMFEIIYYKSKDATGVNLEPVHASSLAGPWSTTGMTLEKLGEEGNREIWKASVPRATGGFMKLRASLVE